MPKFSAHQRYLCLLLIILLTAALTAHATVKPGDTISILSQKFKIVKLKDDWITLQHLRGINYKVKVEAEIALEAWDLDEGSTITLRYFSTMEELFPYLECGKVVGKSYIDFDFDVDAYLDIVNKKKKENYKYCPLTGSKILDCFRFPYFIFLEKTLHFDRCYIKSIMRTRYNDTDELDTLSLELVVTPQINMSYFKLKRFYFTGAVDSFWFSGNKLKADFEFYNAIYPKNKSVCEISNCQFGGNGIILLTPRCSLSLTSLKVNNSLEIRNHCDLWHALTNGDSLLIDIENCTFKTLGVEHSPSLHLTIGQIVVQDSILLNDRIKKFMTPGITGDLSETYFKEGEVLYTTISNDLSKLHLSIDAIRRLRIRYQYDSLSSHNIARIEQHFDNLISYVREYNSSEDSRKGSAISWLEYQKIHYQMEYYKHSSCKDKLNYAWLLFLDVLVNNGYNGEKQFLLLLVSIVLLFAFIYKKNEKREVLRHIASLNKTEDSKKRIRRKALPPNNFIDFFQCAWFSFILFVTPKFPASYFKFSKPLLLLIFLEWIIGLFLMVLFFIYIASKYQFVQFLFGK